MLRHVPAGGLLGSLLCALPINLLGGVLHTVFSLINAVTGTLNASDSTLSNQSNVSYISLDRPSGRLARLRAAAVNAPVAWNSGLDGTGIGIAVIDSGIYHHPDLNGPAPAHIRVVYRQSFIGGTQFDDFGHGTHVAGIAAGNGSRLRSPALLHVEGIAPNANLSIFACSTEMASATTAWSSPRSKRPYSSKQVQRSGHQPFARTADLRKLHARSAMPGGGRPGSTESSSYRRG